MPLYPIARLDIRDVPLVVIFLDPASPLDRTPEERLHLYHGLARRCARNGESVAAVWQDQFARSHFIAPPQQHPFFAAVSYDQLRAQVNDSFDDSSPI